MLERYSIPRRALDFEDYLDMLRRNVLWVIGPAFFGLVATTVVAFLLKDTFVSTALLRVVPPQIPESMIKIVNVTPLVDRINAMAERIESRNTLSHIITTYGLYKQELKSEPLDDVIAQMQHAIHITASGSITSSGRTAPAFQLSFTYRDRHLAQQVCAELTNRFINLNLEEKGDIENNVTAVMRDEFESARKGLDALEQKVTDFRIRNNGRLPEQVPQNVQQMTALEARIAGINTSQSRVSQEKMILDSQLSIAKDRLAAIRDVTPETQIRSEKIDTLDHQINTLETNIASMKERYTDSYPDLESARSELALLRRQRDDALKQDRVRPTETRATGPSKDKLEAMAEVERLQTALRAKDIEAKDLSRESAQVEAAMRSYQSRIEGLPVGEREYAEITRDRDVAKERYQDLQTKLNASQMSTRAEGRKLGETLEVIDQASLPETPTEPKRQFIIPVGLGAGIALGFILVAIREIKDTSLKNLKDARMYTQLSILGSVPLLENDLVVQRRKQMMWVGWAAATLLGFAVMGVSIAHYYLGKA
jgi:polysaccharide biosynthesis transport protein